MTFRALTIAGSDPSGGAGIAADLKTFHRFHVYGMSAITLLTVQNTLGVSRVNVLDAELVRAQIDAVLSDIGADAVKTGALGSSAIALQIVEALQAYPAVPLIVDPVLSSKNGTAFLDTLKVLKETLIPRAFVLMPNMPEAEALLGRALPPEDAVKALHALGPHAVLLKGGHAEGPATDLLYDGSQLFRLSADRIDTPHTHGTGCTYSAALTALIARGLSLEDAARRSKSFITRAIAGAPKLGKGQGPVDHFAGSPLLF